MRKLKVYGGMAFHNHKQERAICAVFNQAEAAQLSDVEISYIGNYWCVTGNADEINQALAKPHQLIWTGKF